jgi:hypothetical protein
VVRARSLQPDHAPSFAQPAHLAYVAGRALADPDRAIARATFVRRSLEAEAGRTRRQAD